jgi:hypothetical protein
MAAISAGFALEMSEVKFLGSALLNIRAERGGWSVKSKRWQKISKDQRYRTAFLSLQGDSPVRF